MATSTAPHLEQLELADSLRRHVFALIHEGEIRAALILIRADVHSAALALATGSGRDPQVVPMGQEEPDDAAEDAPTEDAPTEDAPTEDAPTEDSEDEEAEPTTPPATHELALAIAGG